MRLDTARSWRSAIARISTAHLRNERVQMLAHVLPVIEKRYISIPGNRCVDAHKYSTPVTPVFKDPRLFNYVIMTLYACSALRWAFERKPADVCYWLSAFAITATVTFGYRH